MIRPSLTIALGAIALTAGLACAATASTSSEASLSFGVGAQIAPAKHQHCVPIIKRVAVHFPQSSRMGLMKKIVGWRCYSIVAQGKINPIPGPGPLHKRPGKIGGFVNPQVGR